MKYLQLYLDSDYILPIGVNDGGEFQKYVDQHASRRIWLYFFRPAFGGIFESGEKCKISFETGQSGYYGNFWNHIANHDIVPGETFQYEELLNLSNCITNLREWSDIVLGTSSPEVVLNFSPVIPVKSRLAFANYIEGKIGKIRSYSVEMNDLLSSKIVYDFQTLNPTFGDQLLVIQSSGQDILLSTQTWCGDMFMQGEEPLKLKRQGNDFLKEALAKIVVNQVESFYHMLPPGDAKEKEYRYQMQYAEDWLKLRKGDENLWIDEFHYSMSPGNKLPSIEISGKELNLIEKEAIRGTISEISKFYQKNILNKHLHTIFLGDIFREDVFLKDCISVTSSDGKYTYFNDNAVQEAMGRYHVRYSAYTEELRSLERTFMDKANERSRIKSYVHNAAILGALREKEHKAVAAQESAVNDAKNRNENLMSSWESLLRRSAFSEAAEVVKQVSTSDDLLRVKGESTQVLREVERYNSLLIELKQLKEVAPIVDDIRGCEEKLRNLGAEVDKLNNLSHDLDGTVQKYRDLYPKYRELKSKFDNEPTLAGRKNIVEEMKEMTMEEMPVLDIAPITGRITVESKKVGGMLGFGKKLEITLKLKLDYPLPCRGVLVVAPGPIASIPQGRMGVYAIDVDKNASGEVVNQTFSPGQLGLKDSPKSLYIKFWPHEDERIPINRFEVQGGGTITF